MLLRRVLGLIVLGTQSLALAQQYHPDAVANLPSCGLQCLVDAVSKSPCALTDTACICRNETINAEITVCVEQTCTIIDTLQTANVTSYACGRPVRNRSFGFDVVSIVLGVITVGFVVQRFAVKLYAKIPLGLDDWFALLTVLDGIPNTVFNVVGVAAHGLGRDIWTLQPSTITTFGVYFYIMEANYFLLVVLLKLSILFFYLRIFPSETVRKLLWATVGVTCCYGVSFVVAALNVCQPVSYFWTRWDGEHKGTCIDLNAVGWSQAAISIALDIWMLGIPLSQLKGLNLDIKKKIGVGLMFCTGMVVTIVCILRLRSLIAFGTNSLNPTWDYFDVVLWSTLEINIGIICACLPSFRLLLVRLFPKVLGTQRRYGTYADSHRQTPFSQSRGKSQGPFTATSFADNSHSRSDSKNAGIILERSYAVSYGDHDEISLVNMRDVEVKSTGSSN